MNAALVTALLAMFLVVIYPVAFSQAEEPSDFARGVSLRIEQKHREAVAAFAKALAVVPGDAAALVQMGASLEDLGKWKEAEQCFRRALEIDPASTSAKRNLEQLLASRSISVGAKGPGSSDEILTQKGLRALDLKEFDEALRCFNLLQGLLPEDPRPMLYAAMTWERRGDKQQAQALYREIVKSFPSLAAARVNLVVLLLDCGDQENATREVKAALAAMPSDERIRYLARALGAAMRVSEDSAGESPSRGTHQP